MTSNQVSRSVLFKDEYQKPCILETKLLYDTKRKSYTVYRVVQELSDSDPDLNAAVFFNMKYVKNGAR